METNLSESKPALFVKLAVAFFDLLPILEGSDVKVYLAIAKHLNFQTHEAFPGLEKISEESGVCRDTVIKSIKRLEEVGALQIERSHGRSNHYSMNYLSNGNKEPNIPHQYEKIPVGKSPTGVVGKNHTGVVGKNPTTLGQTRRKNSYSNKNKEERREEAITPILSSCSDDKALETSSGLASTDVGSFKENQQQNSNTTIGHGRDNNSNKKKDGQLTSKEQDILNRVNEGLHIKLDPTYKKVSEVLSFIAQEEENGRMLDAFLRWVNEDDHRSANSYKYGSWPQDIKVHWPQAFVSGYNPQGFSTGGQGMMERMRKAMEESANVGNVTRLL